MSEGRAGGKGKGNEGTEMTRLKCEGKGKGGEVNGRYVMRQRRE